MLSSNFSLQTEQYFMGELVYNEEGRGHKRYRANSPTYDLSSFQEHRTHHVYHEIRAEVRNYRGLEASLPIKISERDRGDTVQNQGKDNHCGRDLHDHCGVRQMTQAK